MVCFEYTGSGSGIFLNCYVFSSVFAGEFIKKVPVFCLVECVGVSFLYIGLIMVNFLEHRNLLDYGVPWKWPDLLCLPVSGFLFTVFYRLTKSWLERYQTYEPRHKKIMWAVFLSYVLYTQIVSFSNLNNDQLFTMGYYLFQLGCITTLVLMVLLFYRKYRLRLRQRGRIW